MNRLMDIGAASTLAYQRALSTISDNIANANTEGYSRRTADISATSVNTLDPQFPDASLSGSVAVTRITRWQDDLKSETARTALSEKSRLDTKLSWMRDIEAVTTVKGGLDPLVTGLRDAISALSVAPQAVHLRSALLSQADTLANAISELRTHYQQTENQIATAAQNAVRELNDALSALAQTNQQLLRAAPGSDQWAAQADQRDRLLEKIAGLIDINTSLDASGCARVSLANDPSHNLVEGALSHGLWIDQNMQLWADPFGTPHAIQSQQGQIAGLVQAWHYVAARAGNLDNFAHSLADNLNSLSANAINARGVSGLPIFSLAVDAPASQLQLAALGAEDIGTSAAWIAISHGQNRSRASLSLIINNDAQDLPLLASYELHITSSANADLINPATGETVASYALPLAEAQSGAGFLWQLNGTPSEGDIFIIKPAGPNPADISALKSMQLWLEDSPAIADLRQEKNDMAFATASVRRMAEAAESVAMHTRAAVENQRGVNIEEESIALDQLQKAYQAAARVLQTAQNIFDSLMSIRP